MRVINKTKVFVGLSGGVDSAVSAGLLKKASFDVTGVFIKVWQPDWIECTWREDRLDAMRVAASLEIPFQTLDLEAEYKKEVIDYMIEEYKAGRTPNPDVMCNRYVKFGAFWDWAKSKGAEFIATGHYARISQISNLKSQTYSLLKGVDENKDQSYFLWTLNQKDLEHIKFPVGGMTKPEVRKLAKKFKLPNAEKKDSQGLCFIGKIDVKDFIAHYAKPIPGNVLEENGQVIGSHPGALLFTIGERHGFTITRRSPNDEAYYVIDKDVVQNTITVSNKKDSKLRANFMNQVRLGHVNWTRGEAPRDSLSDKLTGRTRYRQPLQSLRLSKVGIVETEIRFDQPQDTITPGQSLVIYDGEECLGGGVID